MFSSSRLNHNPPILPLKRKLENYATSSSLLSPHLSETLAAMSSNLFPLFPPISPPPNPDPDQSQSRVRVSSPSAATTSSSSSIQFFVRTTDSKTLVFHASRHSTVASLLSRLPGATRASSALRIIYSGRQLDPDSTLENSKVGPDSTLHLSGRLRSTRFPCSWRLVDDLVQTCSLLFSGNPLNRPSKSPASLLHDFLSGTPNNKDSTIDVDHGRSDVKEHFSIFLGASAPASLVKLYLSPLPGCSSAAECAIHFLLKSDTDIFSRKVYPYCAPAVLEISRLLAASVCPQDRLYLACRSSLALFAEPMAKIGFPNLVERLFSFISEIAGSITDGLSSDRVVSTELIAEFAGFLAGIRRSIMDWMRPVTGPIPKSLLNNQHPLYQSWISALHALFVKMLMKLDECLKKFESFLAFKSDTVLAVLTCVHKFSKVYEGGRELLHDVLSRRKASVNALVGHAKKNEKLKWLLRHKDVTDFEARRSLTLMLFPEGKEDFDHLHEMLIDRSQLLAESFEYVGLVDPHLLHGGLFMEFKNEEATGPGVLREWFCLVCRAIFNPQNVLFLSCPNDQRRFFPNPASVVDPLHLKYFGFCGRLIALALMHKVQVGVVFDRVFFLQLSGEPITLEDIKDADPCLYMSCKKILEMDAELLDSDILGLTFVRGIEELGTHRAIDLCPGGKDIIVNSNNRERYISLLIQHRFVTSTSEQVSCFARGFGDVLSNSKRQKFFFHSLDLQDFDRMLGGSDGSVDVNDWRAHTEYSGYKGRDCVINWFWKIVEGMSEEQQRFLLFFWTSVKYLPVDGFGGLTSKLYIYKSSASHERLPTSQTCFYRLCLPQYPSISTMRDRLQLITQEHVGSTFGLW